DTNLVLRFSFFVLPLFAIHHILISANKKFLYN
ncbi:unnamed protein product, partial [marine sediment metagenome]